MDARSKLLAEHEGQSYVALTIDPAVDFHPPLAGAPFPCLIWDHDGRAHGEQRAAIARTLLEAGCCYFVCGGQACEAWHDAVDDEFVGSQLDESGEEGKHVMTTWHDGESVEDVALFFVECTNLHEHEFTRFLVLHIGDGPMRAKLDATVCRQVLSRTIS